MAYDCRVRVGLHLGKPGPDRVSGILGNLPLLESALILQLGDTTLLLQCREALPTSFTTTGPDSSTSTRALTPGWVRTPACPSSATRHAPGDSGLHAVCRGRAEKQTPASHSPKQGAHRAWALAPSLPGLAGRRNIPLVPRSVATADESIQTFSTRKPRAPAARGSASFGRGLRQLS